MRARIPLAAKAVIGSIPQLSMHAAAHARAVELKVSKRNERYRLEDCKSILSEPIYCRGQEKRQNPVSARDAKPLKETAFDLDFDLHFSGA